MCVGLCGCRSVMSCVVDDSPRANKVRDQTQKLAMGGKAKRNKGEKGEQRENKGRTTGDTKGDT